MALLELRNIYKNYSQGGLDVPALSDINLNIEEGEYVAIMGPSGSGKSTLMNIIGCLDKPTKGTYILSNEDISGLNDRKLSDIRNKEIGFVFQQFNLMPRQSALQNVELPLQYAHVPRRDRRPLCEQALIKVGLEDIMNFKATQLSGGQKQRVAIARAIVNKPSILLADEPTGALDSKSGIQVMKLFKQLHSEGSTIIMITHAQEIAEHANRIIKIFDGEITSDEPNTPVVIPVSAPEDNNDLKPKSETETRLESIIESKLESKIESKKEVEKETEKELENVSAPVPMAGFESVNPMDNSPKSVNSEPISGPSVIPGFQMDSGSSDNSIKNDITSRFESIKAETTTENEEDPDTEVDYDLDEDYAESNTEVLSETVTQNIDEKEDVDSGIELYDTAEDVEIDVKEHISGGDSV